LSKTSIPFVKVKYGSALKDNGIKTIIGARRNRKMIAQKILKT
jgi:hypothetical protein